MSTNIAKDRARLLRRCVAAAAIVLSGSALADATTPASPSVASGRIGRLERVFWKCDYIVTTRGTPGADACFAVANELMHAKFGGDFRAMLAWWRENKPAVHRELRAALNHK